MSRILIRNVRIFETRPPFSVKENMDVLIEDSIIKKVGENLGEKAETIIDGSGKTLIPGNVCAHHHYYSGLSRGMLISWIRSSTPTMPNLPSTCSICSFSIRGTRCLFSLA